MLLEVSRITNDAEHGRALERLEQVWNASEGDDLDELNILTMLVDSYERERWPLSRGLDPIDIVKGAMEHAGHTRANLVELLGSASRVSEILSRKRALTLEMIRTISEAWGIPLNLLTPRYTMRPAGVVVVQHSTSVTPDEADALMMGRASRGKISRLKSFRFPTSSPNEDRTDIKPPPVQTVPDGRRRKPTN